MIRRICRDDREVVIAEDIMDAYRYALEAAANAGTLLEKRERIIKLVDAQTSGVRFASKVLMEKLAADRNS